MLALLLFFYMLQINQWPNVRGPPSPVGTEKREKYGKKFEHKHTWEQVILTRQVEWRGCHEPSCRAGAVSHDTWHTFHDVSSWQTVSRNWFPPGNLSIEFEYVVFAQPPPLPPAPERALNSVRRLLCSRTSIRKGGGHWNYPGLSGGEGGGFNLW